MEERTSSFISIDDSIILYGIAILLMVFHHLFCIPSRLNYNYIPCLFGFEIESKIAYIGKLCVGIYAFISGYAFSKKNNPHANVIVSPHPFGLWHIINHFIHNVKVVVCALLKFYSRFWLVCIIYIPIGIAFYGADNSVVSILNAFFLGRGYNGEWWYVFQYITFLVVFPFMDTFYFCFKYKWKQSLLFFLACVVFLIFSQFTDIGIIKSIGVHFINMFRSPYLYIFIFAYFIGIMEIYEIIAEKFNLPNFVYCLIVGGLILLRWFVVTDPADGRIDIIITPILIYCLVNLIHRSLDSSFSIRILKLCGRYSIFMWLVHTFWIYYYFQDIVLIPKFSILIFFWVILISLANAIVLDYFYFKIGLNKAVKIISNTCMRMQNDGER